MAKDPPLIADIILSRLKYLTKADTVFANDMKLKRFPKDLIRLKNLTFVDLSKNYLRRVPQAMNRLLPKLQTLILTNNKIQAKPTKNLFKSRSIKTLMLSDNNIKTIGLQTFAAMPSLEVLYLDSNKIEVLSSDVFKSVRRLKFLHLGNNLISHPLSFQDVLPNLKKCILKGNKIK